MENVTKAKCSLRKWNDVWKLIINWLIRWIMTLDESINDIYQERAFSVVNRHYGTPVFGIFLNGCISIALACLIFNPWKIIPGALGGR